SHHLQDILRQAGGKVGNGEFVVLTQKIFEKNCKKNLVVSKNIHTFAPSKTKTTMHRWRNW
ncbi:MAG: hypothetical protein IIT37_13625, partial [Bacteroidales bacterium]|nr:hypothetical protein [Bacteroidales bacterium]